MNLSIGSTIGPYRLTGLIGQGGMGLVYLAEHTLIGKKVAVKTVRPELVQHAGVAERFINEARAVNTVGDEHIVDIFDAGQTPEGALYCVMELLVGESLHDFEKRRGRVELGLSVDIALQIARTLHACHRKQIIHRDLKPANVFLVERDGAPFVKVLDFGIAKLVGNTSFTTQTDAIVGTPYYMAPEQCRGARDLDHRIDIYALGVILYELCTGSLPFEGDSAGDVLIKQATEPPDDPRLRAPDLPEWLSRIILKALEKNRDARFRDMAEFIAALETHAPPVAASRAGPAWYDRSASGGALDCPPTESILLTPPGDAAKSAAGVSFATGSPGSGWPSRREALATERAPDTAPRAEARAKISPAFIGLAAVVVVGLVIVAGRFITASGEEAGSATPLTGGASAPRAPLPRPAKPPPRLATTAGPHAIVVAPVSATADVTAARPPIAPAGPPTPLADSATRGSRRKALGKAPSASAAPSAVTVPPPEHEPDLETLFPPESLMPPK